jgi:hypothetical protein
MISVRDAVLQMLKRELAGLPLSEQQASFAYLEQMAKREGDLAALRAIRQARSRFPTSTPPPKSA